MENVKIKIYDVLILFYKCSVTLSPQRECENLFKLTERAAGNFFDSLQIKNNSSHSKNK